MNPLTCRHAIDLLIDFCARELPDDEQKALQQHFDQCPPCLIYLQSYQVTISLSRRLPREAPLPQEMESQLLAMLKQLYDNPRSAAEAP